MYWQAFFWDRLVVHDAREATNQTEIGEALFHHIEAATNKGRIVPTITVFKEGEDAIRIWNHQLIRYAGYERDGKIIGDPDSVPFTKICQQLGWQGAGTDFDVLPLVVSISGGEPFWLSIPPYLIHEVDLIHPTHPTFSSLQLKWYAVPIISDMRLEIGGLNYYAAPFNGWYMGTEIGARNLADPFRYNRLPQIAELFELDTQKESSLWKDSALVELNRAVLHSYHQAHVTIVDHHTAAKQLKYFEEKESHNGRGLTGNWSWLIPPMSPAATHIFHKEYDDQIVLPNYFYEKKAYLSYSTNNG